MDAVDGPLPCEQALAFGPVPSRRLGMSVGVNVVPRKVCSYNCVYCQLGRTTLMTLRRGVYTPTAPIVEAVAGKLALAPRTDYVTVIGDGEPTLASNLGEVRAGVAEVWRGRIALLTNGSLLWMAGVREEAAGFDAVLPTLSAGDPDTFRTIHRPHRSMTFERYVEGMRAFCSDHADMTWAEVMLVRGVNDSVGSLRSIGALVSMLDPAEVHLTAPLRPPSVSSVRPPDRETVETAMRLIPGAVDFTHPESSEMPESAGDPVRHLVDITGTHPLRRAQAVDILVNAGFEKGDAGEEIDSLVASGALVRLERMGDSYYVRGRRAPRAQHV
jgi:wyosine [tRNA(Phe)-imidazoG37] synthetase (radical SAM superfamily)